MVVWAEGFPGREVGVEGGGEDGGAEVDDDLVGRGEHGFHGGRDVQGRFVDDDALDEMRVVDCEV